MATMIERVKAAARKVHPMCEVEITPSNVVEVLLPEDCGLVWLATEGTMLVADDYGSLSGALKMTLADIRWGVRPEAR